MVATLNLLSSSGREERLREDAKKFNDSVDGLIEALEVGLAKLKELGY